MKINGLTDRLIDKINLIMALTRTDGRRLQISLEGQDVVLKYGVHTEKTVSNIDVDVRSEHMTGTIEHQHATMRVEWNDTNDHWKVV